MQSRVMKLAASAPLSCRCSRRLRLRPAVAVAASPSTQPVQRARSGASKKKKCVDAQRGAVDDDSLYAAGRHLAEQGRYGEAITMLSLAADKTDPRILNYLGYSHRKAGRVTVGLGYYQEALRHDPDYTLVREYMGEAYLQQGNVEAAKEQLTEIEKRCGKGCEEYAELARQIDAYVKG